MKASIVSTDHIVSIQDTNGQTVNARVWEGVSETGVPFTAYIVTVQVERAADNSQFERELQEHKAPERATMRAIDARFIL